MSEMVRIERETEQSESQFQQSGANTQSFKVMIRPDHAEEINKGVGY